MAECGPEELWRGLLDLALVEYPQVVELLAQAEAKLDARAQTKHAGSLAGVDPGRRSPHGRDGGRLLGGCQTVQKRQGGRHLCGSGPAAIPVGGHRSPWPDHPPRPGLAYVRKAEEAYAEHVRERLAKQLQRRAQELGYELKQLDLEEVVLPDGEVRTVTPDGVMVTA